MERFADTARQVLARHPEVTVVLTGLNAEAVEPLRREIAGVLACGSRLLNMAGQTNFREFLALFCLSDVLVASDSGPSQFASMTDIDAVVLFGPETPHSGDRWATGFTSSGRKLACSPCISPFNFRFSPCKDPVCMKEITGGAGGGGRFARRLPGEVLLPEWGSAEHGAGSTEQGARSAGAGSGSAEH